MTKPTSDKGNSFYSKHTGAQYRKDSFHNDKTISDGNKKAVDTFIHSWTARKDIKEKRIAKYYANFRMLFKVAGKTFELNETDEHALEDLVYKVNNSDYSEWTKSDLRGLVKRYYTFKNKGVTPAKALWIKTGNPKPKHKTAEELISRDELEQLLNSCQNERDRAFIMLLYEGGLRAGEMRVLTIGSVLFTDTGMWIDIPEVIGITKTGGRKIPLVETEPYMKSWINAHPGRRTKTSPLWMKIEQYEGGPTPMNYDNMRMMIRKKAKKLGIEVSKINLHNFRHTAASEKAAAGWSKAQMDSFFGWDSRSNTASVYIHLQPRDLLNAMRKLHNLPSDDEGKAKTKIQCQRCGRYNDSDAPFCTGCQVPLSIEESIKAEEDRGEFDKTMSIFMEKIKSDPDMRRMFKEAHKEAKKKK